MTIKKNIIFVSLLPFSVLAAEVESTYNPATQILNAPKVFISGDKPKVPYDFNLKYLGENVCEIVSVVSLLPPFSTVGAEVESVYDPTTQILNLPKVFIGGDTLRVPHNINLKYLGGNACEVVSVEPGSAEDNVHECNNYTPTEKNGSFSGEWGINETDNYTITVPNDPGGGYVRVVLETSDQKAIPSMFIDNFPAESSSITGGSSVGTSNEQRIEDVFEAYPGETYSIRVQPFFNGTAPMPYTIEWEFVSKVDCYEPNNGHHSDQGYLNGKRIPLNQTIEASAIEGFSLNAKNDFDWYRIELSEQTILQLEQLQSPSNALIWFRIFNEMGDHVFGSGFGSYIVTQGEGERDEGRLLTYNPVTLDAGIYYLETEIDVSIFKRAVRLSDNDTIFPDHFETPYKFQVKKLNNIQ